MVKRFFFFPFPYYLFGLFLLLCQFWVVLFGAASGRFQDLLLFLLLSSAVYDFVDALEDLQLAPDVSGRLILRIILSQMQGYMYIYLVTESNKQRLVPRRFNHVKTLDMVTIHPFLLQIYISRHSVQWYVQSKLFHSP